LKTIEPKRITPLYFPTNGIKETEDRFNWMQAVQRDRRLTERARLVLIRLAQFLNLKTQRCDPTVAKLAMMAGLGDVSTPYSDDDDSTVVMARRALKRGEELGWIRRHRRSGGLRNQSNSYEFLVPTIMTRAGLAESIKLRVVERNGRWFVSQVADGVEICGPFKTRETAETWMMEHGPGASTELSEASTELLEGVDRTFGGVRPN